MKHVVETRVLRPMMRAGAHASKALCLSMCLMTAGCISALGPTYEKEDWCDRGFINDAALEQQLRAGSTPITGWRELEFEPFRLEFEWVRPQGLEPLRTTRRGQRFRIHASSPAVALATGRTRAVGISLEGVSRPLNELIVVPLHSGFDRGPKGCTEQPPGIVRRGQQMVLQFLDAARTPLGSPVAGQPFILGVVGAMRYDVPTGARFVIAGTDPGRSDSRFTFRASLTR